MASGGAGVAPDERSLRMARRGSTMLPTLAKVAKAVVATNRMQGMAERTSKLNEEKRRRAEFAMIASTSEQWTWLPDEKDGFIPAKILKTNPDGSVEAEYGPSRAVKTFKKTELGPPIIRIGEVRHHVDGT